MAARKKKERFVHVECASPTGYRWLRQMVANYGCGAKIVPEGGFIVTDEAKWREYLRSAEGREIG